MWTQRNWEDIRRFFKSGKIVTLILFIQCMCCFILVAYIFNNIQNTNAETKQFDKIFNNKISYSITEKGNNEKQFSRYMKYDMEYFNLYKFLDELKSTQGLVFYSIVEQPIDIKAKYVSNKFAYGYEEGIDKESSYSIDKKGNPIIWAKSMQVTSNVLDEFKFTLESGREFRQEDFEYKPDDTVKVILGNEYKPYYKVGDVFDAEYLFTPIKCQVVGILSEKTIISKYGGFISLDRYILLPSFSKVNYYQNPELAKIVLSQQVNGEVTTTNLAIDVKQLVTHLSQKYATLEYNVYRDDISGIENLMNISEESVNQLTIMLITIVIFTIIGISVSFLGRIKRNYKTYAIHLMSGATLWDIGIYTFNAIAVVISLALCLAVALSVMFFGIGSYLLIMCALAVVVLILSCIQPIYKIINMETSMLIRREE